MSDRISVDDITEAMQPDMADYADDAKFYYWMDYACELDEIALVAYRGDGVVEYLNERMAKYTSDRPQHHACVDVATTMENLIPEHKGVFKYE